MSAHLFPHRAWASISVRSSSAVHGSLLLRGREDGKEGGREGEKGCQSRPTESLDERAKEEEEKEKEREGKK